MFIQSDNNNFQRNKFIRLGSLRHTYATRWMLQTSNYTYLYQWPAKRIKNTVLNMQKKIVDISRRCICCGAGKIYIFSLIHTTRVSYIMFNKANQNLTSTCEDLSSAWEIMIILVEVTYMVHSGKDVLADNSFTILKNKYLLDNYTHHLVLLKSVTLV